MKTTVSTRIPKVIEKSLKNQKLFKKDVWGYADTNKHVVVLEKAMGQRTWIEIYLHEHLHNFFPDLPERHVTKLAGILADGIWKKGYRRTAKKTKTRKK